MPEPLTFRSDLYRGTARFYDEFRLPYPQALVDDLVRRTGADGTGRLLDLACGPGTVTFALTAHFREVTAVDLEAESIEFASDKARRSGVGNVTWSVGRAEAVTTDEPYDVVTVGTAFHRLDRATIAMRARSWLRPGGHLALLWGITPIRSEVVWQAALAGVVVDWMGRADPDDRIPPEFESHLEEHPHEVVLRDAGFELEGRHQFVVGHDWTIESLIGFVYSTSLLPRDVLGDRADAFEAEVHERLFEVDPTGRFHEDATFAFDLARNPTV